MPESGSRRGPRAASRNSEIDAIDLAAGFDLLPPAADPAYSPLADVGRPVGLAVVATEPAGAEEPASPLTHTTGDADGTRRPSSGAAARAVSPKGRRGAGPDLSDVRNERDERRARLVREALLARGVHPEAQETRLPKGAKHRPTIELSPDDYAAITVATTLRPDLFGSTLVSFIRVCARNWEAIGTAISSAD